VPAEVVRLADFRRPPADDGLTELPLEVQPEHGAVRVLLGAGDDEVELGLTPEQAEAFGAELARAARAARRSL
jgi:hypothetical protein